MSSINKENVRKWVEALRSGKYKQGRETLRRPDGNGGEQYCCLGVACVLAGLKPVGETKFVDAQGYGSDISLPLGAVRWLGVNRDSPQVHTTDLGAVHLSTLNDGNEIVGIPRSFEEIADLIEKEFLSEEVQHGS